MDAFESVYHDSHTERKKRYLGDVGIGINCVMGGDSNEVLICVVVKHYIVINEAWLQEDSQFVGQQHYCRLGRLAPKFLQLVKGLGFPLHPSTCLEVSS